MSRSPTSLPLWAKELETSLVTGAHDCRNLLRFTSRSTWIPQLCTGTSRKRSET